MKQKILMIICGILFCGLYPGLKAQDCKPKISLDGYIVFNKITPENLAKCTLLKVTCPGTEEKKWKVDSFRIIRVPRIADPITVTNEGHVFSEQALDILRDAKVDDIFFFEEIKLISTSGEDMELAYILQVY